MSKLGWVMNIVRVLVYGVLFFSYSYAAFAHHVLGRPSYSLNEGSTTPPSMQVETQMGEYFITFMVFPAFPSPNESGRVNLYVSRIDTGEPFLGSVVFKVRDDSWFSRDDELLGVQAIDDNVFRQGFKFHESGKYIIRAEFESDDEPYLIDFPLRIGKASAFGPIGLSVAVILFALIMVNLIQRKNLIRTKISNTHKGKV